MIKNLYNFKRQQAQVTTLFVVILAVMLFLVTVIIDMSQVAMNKTAMDVAVDGTALYLGSMLTSHAKSLSDQAAEGKVYHEESGGFFSGWFGEYLGYVIIVACIVGMCYAPNPGWAIAIAAVMGATAWGLGEIYRRQAVMEAFSDNLKLLNSEKDQYRESILLQTISGVVNDNAKVVDVHDIDQDNNTTEWVGRFINHYEERLRLLVTEQGDQEPQETIVDDILDTLDDLINGSNNLLSLRNYFKGNLWDLFTEIDIPTYNSSNLASAISDAKLEGYSLTYSRINTLAQTPPPGYYIDEDIWHPNHPHAEINDNLPPDPPWDDSTLCQVSVEIYEIYYEGEGGFPCIKVRVEDLLKYSANDIMELINNGSGDIFFSEVESLCAELESIEQGIDEGITLLELKQTEIDNDVQDIEDEIELLVEAIANLPNNSPKLPAFNNLLIALNDIKQNLENLEVDIENTKIKLDTYNNKLSARRLKLESLVDGALNFVIPVASGIGKAVYVWEDSKGWHIVKAFVDSNIVIPNVTTRKTKKWNKTVIKIKIEPYASSGSQQIEINARRFDDPISTPWWNFYPSGRYDQGQWATLTANLDSKFIDGGGFVVEGEPLYDDVDDFVEDYGLKVSTTSFTSWANRTGKKSRWRIGIVDPE